MSAEGDRTMMLELRPSVLLQALSLVSPAVLVALGGYGVAAGEGAGPGPWLLGVGLVLVGAVAVAVPWRTTIDADGVVRQSWVRQQQIPWSEVVAFERHRGRASGALIVRTTQRRRLALSDVPERPAAWDRLRELVHAHAEGVALPPPPAAHPFSGGAGPPGAR